MGKRSEFDRVERDHYPTFDPRAVRALLPHLPFATHFVEPCAAGGVLLDQLVAAGHVCVEAYDIEPLRADIAQRDALTHRPEGVFACFITNPPWSRPILHPLIERLSDIAPTWFLFDADWKHTKQARPYLPRLRRIVSVGRLKWIEESKHDGKDNCAWFLFGRPQASAALFFGRANDNAHPYQGAVL